MSSGPSGKAARRETNLISRQGDDLPKDHAEGLSSMYHQMYLIDGAHNMLCLPALVGPNTGSP